MKKLILSLCFLSNFAFAADPETIVFSFQKQKNPDEIQVMAKTVAE